MTGLQANPNKLVQVLGDWISRLFSGRYKINIQDSLKTETKDEFVYSPIGLLVQTYSETYDVSWVRYSDNSSWGFRARTNNYGGSMVWYTDLPYGIISSMLGRDLSYSSIQITCNIAVDIARRHDDLYTVLWLTVSKILEKLVDVDALTTTERLLLDRHLVAVAGNIGHCLMLGKNEFPYEPIFYTTT